MRFLCGKQTGRRLSKQQLLNQRNKPVKLIYGCRAVKARRVSGLYTVLLYFRTDNLLWCPTVCFFYVVCTADIVSSISAIYGACCANFASSLSENFYVDYCTRFATSFSDCATGEREITDEWLFLTPTISILSVGYSLRASK